MRLRKIAEIAFLLSLLILLGLFFNQNRPEGATQFAGGLFAAFDSDTEKSTPRALASADIQTISEAISDDLSLDEFGFEIDHFEVEGARIRRGLTFADILTEAGVNYSEVVSIAESVASDFDVTRLRAGRDYQIYEDKWLAKPRYLVYQESSVRYVTIDLLNKTVERGEREVEIVEKEATGTIRRSLYQTVRETGADSRLVYRMADMFAWQVDFHRVQPGDNFHVVYEQEMIDDEIVGIRNIIAARFQHRDEDNYGIYFDNGEQTGHFDENGESLRKMLLQAPLEYSRISSGYQENRVHPITGQNRPHRGTDYAAPHGTPIRSVGDGVIDEAGYSRGNGNYVRVRHNAEYTTQYLHMSRFADNIRPGVEVEQGETIGYVGSTGLATGPHVCFRFWKNGRQVNHRQLEMPSSEPVEEAFEEEYFELAEGLLPRVRPENRTVADENIRTIGPSPTASR